MSLSKIFKISVRNGRSSGDSTVVNNEKEGAQIQNLIYSMSVNYQEQNSIVEKIAYSLKPVSVKRMDQEANEGRRFQMAYDEAYSTYLQMLIFDEDIKHMRAMLEMLNNSRFKSKAAWLEIIKSLASDPEIDHYHCLAIMIAKDRNNLVKDEDGNPSSIKWTEFKQYWSDAISSSSRELYSSNSIHYWATCDSPSQMHRYTTQTIRNMMIRDIRHPLVRGKINHSQVASYLYFMFKNTFATKDVPKSTPDWYEFVTPRTRDIEHGQIYKWRYIGSHPDSLAIYMITEFKEIATALYMDMKALCAADGDTKEKDARMKIISDLSKAYLSSIQHIFGDKMKTSAIKEAATLFKKNAFIGRLDKSPHIIGVSNGVLVFLGPNVTLIQQSHAHPISLYTDTKYNPYNENCKDVNAIYKMLRSLVPDGEEDALEFLLYYLCTSLDGLPKESLFLIIHGGGCHAIDTAIRMSDGSVKMVQDVAIGDRLMGDDGTPRTVQELFHGTDDMYRITPKMGGAFEVNKDHLLSLKLTNANKIIDIKVKDLIHQHVDWMINEKVLLYKGDQTTTTFSIEYVGAGNYYGFELDGNHRYQTSDGFVHHNSNGKTVLMELFRRTLGEHYVRKMPLSFIVEGRNSSAKADPAIMELKNARLVYYSESANNEKVNVAKVKEITGGETLSGRQLYQGMENFTANCNHIVTTNHRFVIESTEHAVWRRFISYKFKICFKVHCNPEDPLERPREPELINQIKNDKRYHAAFLSILIHYRSKLYAEYDGQILKVPHPTIANETEQYRQDEDIYQRYIMNYVHFVEGCHQQLEVLVKNFREFYRLEGSGSYNGKTADTIHIFRNSSLQPHIKEENGKYVLHGFRSFGTAEGTPDGVIPYSAWLKQTKTRSQTSSEN